MRMTGRIGLTALVLSGVLAAGAGMQAASRSQADERLSPALAAAIADFDAGRYVEARAGLMAAIARSPQDAVLYHWLSRAYLRLGDDERAVASAEAAVARMPANSDTTGGWGALTARRPIGRGASSSRGR